MENIVDQIVPRIGIIGGAGPTAGAVFFEKIIQICQRKYGCTRDLDFPYCLLLSYPFADMLTDKQNRQLIETQLQECFEALENSRISIAAIACNTLHAFLPKSFGSIQFVHMIKETADFLRHRKWEDPLVLCTSTSANAKLHAQYFSCRYLDSSKQAILDDLIDEITIGRSFKETSEFLNSFKGEGPIILGCTELSLLNEKMPLDLDYLCDPIEITVEKMLFLRHCQMVGDQLVSRDFEGSLK